MLCIIRFQNPIENGQHTNSTSDDVKIMNQRSHILYEQLKGFVQRMDMNVVKNDLPEKKVFVVTVKLSQLQRKLYRRFLDVNGFSSSAASEKSFQRSGFFAKYQTLALVRHFCIFMSLLDDMPMFCCTIIFVYVLSSHARQYASSVDMEPSWSSPDG